MTLVNNIAITLVTIIGLIILVGIGKVTSGDALPIIAALAGVHIGTNLPNAPVAPTAPSAAAVVAPPPVTSPTPPVAGGQVSQ